MGKSDKKIERSQRKPDRGFIECRNEETSEVATR